MGIFSNPWQGIDRFIRHPIDEITHPFGHKNQWQHFKNDVKDAGNIAGEVGLAMATGGESLVAEAGIATAKQWGSTAGKSLWGTAKKKTRVAKRKVMKSPCPIVDPAVPNFASKSINLIDIDPLFFGVVIAACGPVPYKLPDSRFIVFPAAAVVTVKSVFVGVPY